MNDAREYFTQIYVALQTRQPGKRKVVRGNSFYSYYSSNEAAALSRWQAEPHSPRAVLNQHELDF